MGIKGIYGEIGPGERTALTKLAIEKYEQSGRPLRVAVDVSIWLFQIQAGQGGSNPAIRTFYYRLLRLLSLSVQPLFIFDGPHKPPFKRNKRTGHQGATVSHLLAKQLLKLFGFPAHTAPGEAEAECALLQREGIVDAVLSEDVDTLMFGCGLTFRNWSSEGARSNKSPTHVSVYDAQTTKTGKSGLDREGMVLVALMSGGDYITEGIPGCGIKVACEAARAGYGKSLCQLSRTDAAGLNSWRTRLAHELQTNESRYFRVKHKTVKIPDDFPNREVLSYYTHPVVSSASKIQKLKEDILWNGQVDVPGLRTFVAEAFEWTHKIGARKFIRGLAPAILIHKLRVRGDRRDSGYGDVILTAMNEMELVRAICGKRTHFTTDGITELRVIYHPADIVGLDMDAEEDDTEDYGRDGLAPANDQDEIEAYFSDEPASTARNNSPTKRGPCVYDPSQPGKAWIPETIAKVGIPLKVEDYEESLRNPHKFMKAKQAAKKATAKGGTPRGTMDKFVKISKPGMDHERSRCDKSATISSSQPAPALTQSPRSLERFGLSQPLPASTSSVLSKNPHSTRSIAFSSTEPSNQKPNRPQSKSKTKDSRLKPPLRTNPRTAPQPNTSQETPKITKYLNRQTKPGLSTQSMPSEPHTYDLTSSSPYSASTPLPTHHSAIRAKNGRPVSRVVDTDAQHASRPRNAGTVRTEGDDVPQPLQLSSPTNEHDQPSTCKKRSLLSTSNGSAAENTRSLSSHSTSLTEPVNRTIDFNSAAAATDHSPELPELPTIADRLSPRDNGHAISRAGEKKSKTEPNVVMLSTSLPTARSPGREDSDITRDSPPLPLGALPQRYERPKPVKKYIALRESLPGTWKEVGESEVDSRRGRRMWRESQVEILDLTRD